MTGLATIAEYVQDRQPATWALIVVLWPEAVTVAPAARLRPVRYRPARWPSRAVLARLMVERPRPGIGGLLEGERAAEALAAGVVA